MAALLIQSPYRTVGRNMIAESTRRVKRKNNSYIVLVDRSLCYNESMAETQPSTPPTLPTSQDVDKETERRNRQMTITIGIAAVVFLAFVILSVIFLMQDGGRTERIRDIFIIF